MKFFLLISLSAAALSFFYLNYNGSTARKSKLVGVSNTGTKKFAEHNKTGLYSANTEVTIEKIWEMPDELKEISGLAYIDEKRFACVQDESGVIFIYNTSSEKVEKEITFGKPDDYEGIAINGSTAYIVTSDGKLAEVTGMMSNSPSTKFYKTSLTADENVEGLCFDKKNNRLLLAVKDKDDNFEDYKGVYAFNLENKKFVTEAIYKIDLNDQRFSKSEKKNRSNFNPSGMDIHPLTGQLYIVDGRKGQLLAMDSESNITLLVKLEEDAFSQPEGLAFNPGGQLFISNEGKKNQGNILKVNLNTKDN